MKKIVFAVTVLAISASAVARGPHGGHSSHAAGGTGAKAAHEHVSGYTTKKGTYVAPHERSTGDGAKANNWSTKGNVNPVTGKKGTK